MDSGILRRLRCATGLLLLSLVAATAMADSGLTKVVGGVTIYVGVVPAEIIRGHPKEHPEGMMHGGVSGGRDQYHVMVSLFDANTGQRITDADVTARVAELGRSGSALTLEPMNIANTVTYGNYFRMSGRGPFVISLQIRRPNRPQPIEAQFEHKHQ